MQSQKPETPAEARRRISNTEPTTSDPMRDFSMMLKETTAQKENEASVLLNKICNSKFYTIDEYREIDAMVRKLAGLPPRDYARLDKLKKAAE